MSFLSLVRGVLTMSRGVVAGLPEPSADADPVDLFRAWFADAEKAGLFLPESMTLATASPDGRPSARMVLLKGAGADGFVFYTNYESRKADELALNPHAALVFHWAVLQRQVRVEGPVERVPEETSARYFRSRPRGSRIGAWASRQSRPLADRAELEARIAAYEAEYPGEDVPRPDFWGGYRVRPERIEFWQGRLHRLHDRLVFLREGDGWRTERLYP